MKKAGRLSCNQGMVVVYAPLRVKAAAAAGIFTIAVNTGPLDDHTLGDAGANMVLPSMQTLAENWDEYYKEISAITV